MSKIERVRRVVIANGCACTPAVTALDNGEILVAYSDRVNWEVKLTRSTDSGLTWSDPVPVAKEPRYRRPFSHIGMSQLSNGRLLLPFMDSDRCYVMRSDDGGHAWDEPIRLRPPGVEFVQLGQYGRIRELQDGTVILPVFGCRKGERQSTIGHLRSGDGGESWPVFVPVCTGYDQESDTMQLPDGRMLSVFRHWLSPWSHGMSSLYWCWSEDNGLTWTTPEPTFMPMYGHSPCLFMTKKGTLICAYRYVGDLDINLSAVSYTVGRWQTDSGPFWEMSPEHIWMGSGYGELGGYRACVCGYPDITYINGNQFLCVYWMSWRIKPKGGAGTVEVSGQAEDIEGVIFTEPD